MPRIDNSSDEIIDFFDLDYDPDDPGDTPPVDLCANCWLEAIIKNELDGYEIEHPNYEDDYYRCHSCDALLTAMDNYY